MSTIAVFLALGGTSYAVARNSVGTPQLKNNAVTSAKVRDGALQAQDFAAGALLRGPRGPAGPQGQAGPAGPSGPSAALPAVEAWKPLTGGDLYDAYGAPYGPAEFRKDQFGYVHVRGLVTRRDGSPTAGQTIGVLPAGYRPQRARIFAVHTGQPHGLGRVDVGPDGVLRRVDGATGETDYTSLDGIFFATD